MTITTGVAQARRIFSSNSMPLMSGRLKSVRIRSNAPRSSFIAAAPLSTACTVLAPKCAAQRLPDQLPLIRVVFHDEQFKPFHAWAFTLPRSACPIGQFSRKVNWRLRLEAASKPNDPAMGRKWPRC